MPTGAFPVIVWAAAMVALSSRTGSQLAAEERHAADIFLRVADDQIESSQPTESFREALLPWQSIVPILCFEISVI